MKIASARSRVMPRTSATSTSPSPSRSSPKRRIVWIVTPWFVAPPGSSGSLTKPPSRATISRAMSEISGMAAPVTCHERQAKALTTRLTPPCTTVRRGRRLKGGSASAGAVDGAEVAFGVFVDALFLQRIHHFLGHVILVVLGQDLRRHEHAVFQPASAHHALILLEQIGKNPLVGHRHHGPAIGHVEAHRLALAAHDAALFDQTAHAEHFRRARR